VFAGCEIVGGAAAEALFRLTGQMRRSSRSVCLNLREAWAKRRYEAHFTSKPVLSLSKG